MVEADRSNLTAIVPVPLTRTGCRTIQRKLQALAYDILPPATAIVDYAAGLGKLSANGQLFDGVQTAIGL